MAPSRVPDPEEVVITGMSGRLPDSDNLQEFKDNLYNKVDMVTNENRRWDIDHPEIPKRGGLLRNLSKFDASFFAVHYKQAHSMDPMCRMLMELAYEAVVDAGVNPASLRGTKTGCFVGACYSESEKIWFYDRIQSNGFGITGCSRAMLANRISYWLDIHGPSYSVDTACSSSLYALDHALKAMRSGQCEAALVGGVNLTLHPYVTLQFSRLGVLSMDGKCKSFSEDADGYCRSEGIVMIFLQKAKDAKRIYATLVHSKTNQDGYKEQGITFPSGRMQGKLLEDCYRESGISPAELRFLEAHGTGTKVGDPEEVNAIDRVLCSRRTEPLLIGSVKSNIGHGEPASAISSVIKVVLAMETGLISPNLHFTKPRSDIPALAEGRVKVVSEVTPWEGGVAGVSSFGFGGSNAHAILRSNPNAKTTEDPSLHDGIPRLVVASGRTEEAVQTIIKDLESKPVDSEQVALLLNVHATQAIPGHIYRGYTVLHGEGTEEGKQIREVQYYPGAKRPLWFVFAGMGSQWAGMGRDLLRLETFAKAIDRCDAVLKPRGLDIREIITDPDPHRFDNILNSFVGIAAIQIGLVDLLTEVGIVPDGIVGHSVGELGCAYADGCFTPEEMVLAAYSRGLASIETELIHGSMAAVGLAHDALAPLCPPDIEIACHNGTDSSTISGPAESVKVFVADLKAKNIFAREVACSNIAYHSRYIAEAGPKLLKYLNEVIPEARPRSARWISSSAPEDKWDEPAAKTSSPIYHTNNLLRPVLFAEALRHVPSDAITIEIAPHGLLQAILRRTLSKECTNIALTQRGTNNALDVLFSAFGKLYMAGLQPQVQKLHPPVTFPVNRGTAMISPLVRWQHSDDWHVSNFMAEQRMETGERTVCINVEEEEHEFYRGHVIDGRNLFPAAGYLVLVWESLAMMTKKTYTDLPVVFEDVKFLRATSLPKQGFLDLTIMVTKGTGTFEVVEGTTPLVTGRICVPEDVDKEVLNLPRPTPISTAPNGPLPMETSDVYKELKLRGYQYSGIFKAIEKFEVAGMNAMIRWDENWVSFVDNMLQCEILQLDSRSLYVPTGIRKLVIDPRKHAEALAAQDGKNVPMTIYKYHELLYAGGVQILGLRASLIARRKTVAEPLLECYSPLTYSSSEPLPFASALRALVQVVIENTPSTKFKVFEWVSPIEADYHRLLGPHVSAAFGDLPLIKAEISVVGASTALGEVLAAENSDVLVDENTQLTDDLGAHLVLSGDGGTMLALKQCVSEAAAAVAEGSFLLVRSEIENQVAVQAAIERQSLSVVSVITVTESRARADDYSDDEYPDESVLFLARKVEKYGSLNVVLHVDEESQFVPEFRWLPELQKALRADPPVDRIYMVSQHASQSGLLGLMNCIKEEGIKNVRCVLILDEGAPEFSLVDPFYAEQLRHDLLVNVLPPGGCGWASYRHLPVAPIPTNVTHAYLDQATRGDLSSFQWLQGPITSSSEAVQKDKHLYHVYLASLNFRDVMVATGKLAVEVIAPDRLSQSCVQGLEFAGREPTGKRVMGLVTCGALANLVLADPHLVWEVPATWTLEEAATVPAVYCTVYYSLVMRGRLRAGESILIHSGTGGVGQAAINLALHMGCVVYVTVGTAEKRAFLHKTFPAIPDCNIGNSRDTSFEQIVMDRTNGEGVDVVLNSLAGDKLFASLRCLRRHGRFLEIGKVDMAADTPLGMYDFLKDISVHGVLLDSVIDGSEQEKRRLHDVLTHGIRSGAVKPLKRQVFGPHQVETAYRFMASGKHIGKVLIRIREEETDGTSRGMPITVKPLPRLMGAMPRFYCDPEKSYIIIGGLGGFGLELADWLILRGARKIVLNSRSGISNGYQAYRIRLWESYGVSVVVSRSDVTCEQGCITLLEGAARKMGPVDMIFNLAVILRDALLENQNIENFVVSFMPKARVTQLLDVVSRRLCTSLRQFVVFSSVSSGLGNAGQTNYGFANSVMERICEERRSQGFPALAIQWGAVGDVGLIAEQTRNKPGASSDEPVVVSGTLQQSIASCLNTLDVFFTLPESQVVVSSMVVAEKSKRGSGLCSMVDMVINILGIKDLDTISQHSTLPELGMDSMMAVEIKQTLEREFEMFLSPQDLRSLTFARLKEHANSMQETEPSQRQNADKQEDHWYISGLQKLMFSVGTTALSAKDATVALPSENSSGRKTMFMVPGVEGFAWMMEPLAKKLSLPVCCLQLPMDSPSQDVSTLAKQLLKALQSKQPKGPYLLLGFSFGVLPLLEMVWELQQRGQESRVWLLDGTPESIKSMAKTSLQIEANNEEHWHSIFLEKLLRGIGRNDSAQVSRDLVKLPNWSQRLAYVSKLLPDETHREFHTACVDVVFRRISHLINYTWSSERKLRCPITFLTTDNTVDYNRNLQQICETRLTTYTVESTHSALLVSNAAAGIINEELAKITA